MKPTEILAALVTTAEHRALEQALWFNSAGIGSLEEQWKDFLREFEKVFGISWTSAKQVAKSLFQDYP